MVMLISWIMIWPSAVMMDCSFSSSIWGILAFSPGINGNVWISCWCETTCMVYQGQYHLMSGPGPCQENLFSRFSLYCSLLRRDIAWPDRIAFLVNAILIVERRFSKLSLDLCIDRQLGTLERQLCIEDLRIGVIVYDRASDTLDILFDNAKRIGGVDKPLLALFSRLAAGERNVHVHQQRAVSGLVHLFCF